MKKVVVLGCGFSGLSAAAQFSGRSKGLSVTALDRKEYFDFLPMLPDVIGRGIPADCLRVALPAIAKKERFDFVKAEVTSVDLARQKVITARGSLDYDYLVIAAGSETNFYGNSEAEKFAYKLDDAEDAQRLLAALNRGGIETCIISGGGYTGVEIATNLRIYAKKRDRRLRVIIVEKAPGILGPLPEWMKEYVAVNLKLLGIEVLANTTIEKIEQGKITVGGQTYPDSILLWAAGVKVANLVPDVSPERNPQGRFKVDQYLRFRENCFIVGDAAYVASGKSFLRMAVQFAIAQGALAAGNIIRATGAKAAQKYRPRDFGYIIPMANNRSCGGVFGLALKGKVPTALHYLMCLYRSRGLRNRFGVIAALMKGGPSWTW